MHDPQTDTGKKLPHTRDRSSPENLESMVVPIHSADTPELGIRRFIFRSPAMRALYNIATQVGGSDASVLIYGESGTGKELFARLIHTLSDRNAKTFVPVNCGVLQGELFADKFFGHESGAFTGASRPRKGAFEMAATGTLFLDEVGEIPAANQVDFLRVLEEKSFRRMGGEKDIPFQARIVAATNRPLIQMMQQGEFRADLFYRLNVVPVRLPPLRERKEDIDLLTEHLLSMFRHQYHRHDLMLNKEVLELFHEYPWPGNVRELRNLVERLVLLAQEPCIGLDCLPIEMQLSTVRNKVSPLTGETDAPSGEQDANTGFMLDAAVREAEVRAIIRAFKHTGGHKGKTAKILGISERSLRYKMARYSLGL